MPEGAGGEASLAGGQVDLQPPGGAGEQVERADDAACAAVGVAADEVIHGRKAVGRVADDAVVGLDAAAGPRPAHGDVTELDDVVEVDEGLAGRLVNRRPDLPADLRQDQELQVFIGQLDHLPLLLNRLVSEAVIAKVGVEPGHVGYGVRVGVGVGREGTVVFPNLRLGARAENRCAQRRRAQQKQREAAQRFKNEDTKERRAEGTVEGRIVPSTSSYSRRLRASVVQKYGSRTFRETLSACLRPASVAPKVPSSTSTHTGPS